MITMSLDTPQGSKVQYAYPTNGYRSDQFHAVTHLTVGETYTVQYIDIGSTQSSVILEEFPHTEFNTVMFAPVEEES